MEQPTRLPDVGTVVAIRRYPVKSMQAEAMDAAELHWTWLHGDRQYAFVKQSNTSDFPWLTARTLPDLVLHRARYSTSDDRHATVVVTDPSGRDHDIRDQRLLAELSERAGTPLWLLRLGRGAFDAMAVSVITTTTGEAIGAAHGAAVSLDRFRANIVVQPDDPAVSERDWFGRRLVFGRGPQAASIGVDWPIPRCAMIGIDPVTAVRDAGVVRTVVQRFGNRVGAYCSVQVPGTIRVGDRVRCATPLSAAPRSGTGT